MEYVVDNENKIWRRQQLSVQDLQNLIDTLESEITQQDQVIAAAEETKLQKQAQIIEYEALIAEATD